MDEGDYPIKKKSWGARMRDKIKGKVKSEIDHKMSVRSTYNQARKAEEIKFASERAKRDVRSGGGSSRTAQRLLNAAKGGGVDRDYSGIGYSGSGGSSYSDLVDDALGSSRSSKKKSKKSSKKKSRRKPRKESSKGFASVVNDTLGGF